MVIADMIGCRDAIALVDIPPDELREVGCVEIVASPGSLRGRWRGLLARVARGERLASPPMSESDPFLWATHPGPVRRVRGSHGAGR
jgi:hypothetical protein